MYIIIEIGSDYNIIIYKGCYWLFIVLLKCIEDEVLYLSFKIWKRCCMVCYMYIDYMWFFYFLYNDDY